MKIAIIDDMKAECEKLSEMIGVPFAEHGYTVTETDCFTSGEEFLRTFSSGKYDIIFLDIFMEKINGIETAKTIREIDSMVKLVFVTSSNDFASESYMVDADGYLLKPYNKELLHETIQHLLLKNPDAECLIRFSDGQSVLLRAILYTSYHGHYVTVHTISGDTVKIRTSHNSFADEVSQYSSLFCCNKGLIVNLMNVKKLSSDNFLLTNDTHIPISRRKLATAKNAYTEYLFSHTHKGGR